MLFALVLVPLVLGAIALAMPWPRIRPWLVPVGGTGHALLTLHFVTQPSSSALNGWLVLDPLSKVVLGFLSLLYLLCSFYVPGYLALRRERKNSVFCAALLAFLAMMSLMG